MTSGLTIGFAGTALKAIGVAAALACSAGASMAADNATLKITSFTVSTTENSGNIAWAVDGWQTQYFDMLAQQSGGAKGSSHVPYSSNDWNMTQNYTATTANANATGNLVQFTDVPTQLTTAGFNLASFATPGSAEAPQLPNYANASAVQSGLFYLLDENGAQAAGTITFDIYYDMSVSTPFGSAGGSYGQTQLNLLSSTDGGGGYSFSDGLLSTSLAGGAGSITSGHFTWSYTLKADEAAYYTLSGSAISSAAAIPEPGTYALMALGLAGVAVVARRRRTAAA